MLLALLASLSVSRLPAAQQSEPARAPATTVTVIGVDGRVESRPASSIQGDPKSLGTLGAQVLVFDSTSPPRAPEVSAADVAHVRLTDDQRWIGALRAVDAEHVEVALGKQLALRASIDELSSIVFPERVPAAWPGSLERAAQGDRLYRVRGDALDRVDGAVEEFGEQGVRFHGEHVDSRVFPWSEIAALFVEGAGHDAAAADGATLVCVDLVQGSRVRGAVRSCAGGKLVLAPRSQEPFELAFADMRQLHVDDGRWRYLSELEPSRAEAARPFGDDLGMAWSHRVDKSVTGNALRAAGRYHARGIGVHAPSRLAWKLEPGWKTLRGRAAIDDEVLALPSRGSVVFRVLVDGKKAWESAIVRGGDAPVELPAIDVSSASELVLEVDPGPESFVADRADWLDVALQR